MPRAHDTAVKLDPGRWRSMPARPEPPVQMPMAPPQELRQSAVMLSSLPPVATNVTVGSLKQFYGGRRVIPRRQVMVTK